MQERKVGWAPDLFTPAELGPFGLKNRAVMAPLTRSRAGPGNVPTQLNAQPKLLVGLHVIAQLDPLERNVTTLEKVANGVSGGNNLACHRGGRGQLAAWQNLALKTGQDRHGNHYQSIPSAAQLRHSA